MHIKFGEILSYSMSENEILTSIKDHNAKMSSNNNTLDLVIINALIKFGEILSISSQDIDRKQNSDINQGR